ncbi:hypothetical protein [Rubrivivax albus]|uniref:Uncharacterized protein n=1 Tax=Rubrivivax albus TaxID=2499835 RepID=A0A3S3S7V6_9BURK|nr:hypothetical protein [Rubrivivax albus]RVT47671.1 hypothetical protein ENE75_23925 [Rubrivivax albus]
MHDLIEQIEDKRERERFRQVTELADDQKLVERELNRINGSALPVCARLDAEGNAVGHAPHAPQVFQRSLAHADQVTTTRLDLG